MKPKVVALVVVCLLLVAATVELIAKKHEREAEANRQVQAALIEQAAVRAADEKAKELTAAMKKLEVPPPVALPPVTKVEPLKIPEPKWIKDAREQAK